MIAATIDAARELVFPMDAVLPRAYGYFIATSGIKTDAPAGSKHARMLARAKEVLTKCLPMANIRALVRTFPGDVLSGDELRLGEETFSCAAFGRLDGESIPAVHVYFLTAGDIYLGGANVSDMLFADIWGSSFVDSGLDLLVEAVRTDPLAAVSPAFGPGFYGLETSEMKKFRSLIDPSPIGVTVKESGLLVPLKSCAGFIIETREPWRLPRRDCSSCKGNSGGCTFCAAYIRDMSEGMKSPAGE